MIEQERVVNIDGDIIKYQLGWAVQKTHWTHSPSGESFDGKKKAKDWYKKYYFEGFNEEDWTQKKVMGSWKACKFLVDNKIGEIMYKTEADRAVICLSPSTCFRNDLATIQGYKANRIDNKPDYADKIVEYLLSNYDCISGDNYDPVPDDDIEADDIMGIEQTTNTVIATIDKDLDMIPGEHYNFNKDDLYMVDLLSADEWFFTQLLAGDTTDNIRGIPGIGVGKAGKIVEMYGGDIPDLIEHIKDLYEEHYPENPAAAMEETAALVWILRKGETPATARWRRLLDATLQV